MRRAATCAVLTISATLALGAQGQTVLTTEQTAVLKRIDDHYNRLRTMRAQFTEHYTGLGMDRTETGTLLLKKPGRMRWDYTTPVGKVFVLDGKYAWSYTPGDAQVQRIAAKQVDDLRSPLRFLLGHTQLAKELDQLTIATEPSGFRISGIPKGMARRVRMLQVDTAPDSHIVRIRLEEIDGAVTDFQFEGSKENLPLPDEDFRYVPPAGVAIVDGLPPI